MSNIIKHSDVVLATKQPHDGFRIGDYITDSQFEAFYRLESIETRRWGDSDHEVYVCKGVNPITLELDGNDRDMDLDGLTRYYQVVDADVVNLRDIAHRVLNDGASIEDMQESSDTSLMALGNKQSLIALRQQIDESQRSVTLVKNYCHMMQTQVRNELQKKIDQVNGIVEKMGREIKRLDYVIQTIETNAGIKEGSRILLVSCSDMNSEMFLRYYSDRYSVPDYPLPDVYTVKKNPKYTTDKDYQWREVYRRPYYISYMPKQDAYSWTDGPHDRKIKSGICFNENGYDILNYDNLNIDELDYYLNSRLYRSQYYLYVRLLKTARSLVEREYRQETDFINMLCGELIAESLWPKDGYTHDGIVRIALQTVKDRLKWKRPISSKERETYYLVRRTLFSDAFRKKYFKSQI